MPRNPTPIHALMKPCTHSEESGRSEHYMLSKPFKYGIKYFCLRDVDTSYLCNVQFYVGRQFVKMNEIRTLEWILHWTW